MTTISFRTIPFLIACAISLPPASPVELAGEQDGVYERAAYRVTGDIVVREGRTLSFAPGSVVRFEPYTAVVVRGTLACAGELTAPIILTSVKDAPSVQIADSAAGPFDWNGVRIEAAGRAELSFVKIAFSTYGLDVDSAGSAALEGVVFAKNGRSNLVAGGEIVAVDDAVPFSFAHPEAPRPGPAASDPAIPPAGPVSDGPAKRNWKLPLRIGFCAVAVAGAGMWAGFHYRALDRQESYESAPYPRADEYREERDRAVVDRTVGAILCGAGCVGLGLTFMF
ncbi:MAG: hypothetical protein GF418_11700 [Chitinivibrionales bacterium]|nr:hypothetical protein [Chitinivibrionales bacterium]MBD3396280.1 hypothetical protein [Chitinivibrionales bacterium]